jgi:hypothetical protein
MSKDSSEGAVLFPSGDFKNIHGPIILNKFDFLILLASSLRYYLALEMETKYLSETLVDFYRTTLSYRIEGRTLRADRCENLKKYTSAKTVSMHFPDHDSITAPWS